MSEDIKTCPFCAEEIKSAAIVCKHCGRELPGYEETVKSLQPKKEGEKESPEVVEIGEAQVEVKDKIPKKTSWEAARPFAIVMAVLTFLVGLIYRIPFIAYLGAEDLPFILTLIIPIAINFFGFWVIGALSVLVYRKVGWGGIIGLIVTAGIILSIILFGDFQGYQESSITPTNTKLIPTKTLAGLLFTDTTGWIPSWAPEGAIRGTAAFIHIGETLWVCGPVASYVVRWDKPKVLLRFDSGTSETVIQFSESLFTKEYLVSIIGKVMCFYGTIEEGIVADYGVDNKQFNRSADIINIYNKTHVLTGE